MNKIQFAFSDTIAGYITSTHESEHTFTLETSDKREFRVNITENTYVEVLRNLEEAFQSPPEGFETTLKSGRYVFVYGVFCPEGEEYLFEAERIIFVGSNPDEYRFEEPDWWINQIRALANFYFHAQFPDGNIDYRTYRTYVSLEGQKLEGNRQETDTISRMIYGFATAYMLTGVEHYLEAAEKGTAYLREHMRGVDESEDVVYWYHAMDVEGEQKRKIFASKSGDDYNAIPAYEQIYALAGPVQTYRVNGDPLILRDAEMTINLFEKFFKDREQGGYFSHIDPITFDPKNETLGTDRARKNWNSIGDHAPAYMINLWLATENEKYRDFLVSCADTIEQRFQDYESSPFVQERFYEDWSADKEWGWQQNRAVVGHNLKIAWNLMRIHHMHPDDRYTLLAKKIAETIPDVGMDAQRSGWYDVVERVLREGRSRHRFVWHDRKAWWQQEQAILAYLILHGSLKEAEHLRLARESIAFYNAFFLDHDSGGVYFNVLASGVPYLVEAERLKGNHAMSGYHSFELCYLATVYTNLFIKKRAMDLHFKPSAGSLRDNVLRVQPDILPADTAKIEGVWINGETYNDFDSSAMIVHLPSERKDALNVRVRLIATTKNFDAKLDFVDGTAKITFFGTLDATTLIPLQQQLDKVIEAQPTQVVLYMDSVQDIAKEVARALSMTFDQLSLDKKISVIGANAKVQEVLQSVGVWEELQI